MTSRGVQRLGAPRPAVTADQEKHCLLPTEGTVLTTSTSRRRVAIPAAAAALALALAACGDSNGNGDTEPAGDGDTATEDTGTEDGDGDGDAAAGGRLAELQEAGTITVGFAGEAPYSFQNEAGELVGASVALQERIWGELGIDNV